MMTVLNALVDGRRSYNIPVFAQEIYGGLEFQYGGKWSIGQGPQKVWKNNQPAIHPIWVRYLDEGADNDMILCIGGKGKTVKARPCRYGFDRIRFRPLTSREIPAEIRTLAELDQEDWWEMDLEGSYINNNERQDPGFMLHRSGFEGLNPWDRTMTTPAPHSIIGPSEIEDADAARLAVMIMDVAEHVEFYFEERRVCRGRYSSNFAHTFQEEPTLIWFNDDYWDNCLDEAYRIQLDHRIEELTEARK